MNNRSVKTRRLGLSSRRLAPGYTRTSVHWVMSAKQEKTRQQRLKILIEAYAEGKKIHH